jgi:hypothetical protein
MLSVSVTSKHSSTLARHIYPAAPLSATSDVESPKSDPRAQVDQDGDGVPALYDCDDNNPLVSPFAVEIYCDGIDQNCDGFDNCDADKDGVLDRDDCAPSNPAIGVSCESNVVTHAAPELK